MIKNVLVIMGDHFRHDAFGYMGNPLAHTPNLDRLSSESVRFSQCITQSPVCSPARHSLATGRYVHAHGVLNNGDIPYQGMFTVAHALEPSGLRRFHAGHMHWAGELDNGYEPWICSGSESWLPTLDPKKRAVFAAESAAHIRRTTGGPSPRTAEEHWGWHVANGIIAALKEATKRGNHFLCWCSFTEPHPPFRPPAEYYRAVDPETVRVPDQPPKDAHPHARIVQMQKEWAHLSDHEWRQMIAAYYGMVALADYYVGLVLDAVDRLGIRDETAIIWHSDHGDQAGEHGMMLKFNMREGSVRVPLLVNVPGLPPSDCELPVEAIDLFPTICTLLDAEIPPSVQGRSLVPLLRGERPADWRKECFSQIGDVEMIRTPDWKLNLYGGTPGELFHLSSDPGEFRNLVDAPEARQTKQELVASVERWRAENKPVLDETGALSTSS